MALDEDLYRGLELDVLLALVRDAQEVLVSAST